MPPDDSPRSERPGGRHASCSPLRLMAERNRGWRRRVVQSLVAATLLLALANAAADVAAWTLTHFAHSPSLDPRQPRETLAGVEAALTNGGRLPRAANRITPARGGLPYERHAFAGPDGTIREAWYLP